MKDCSQNHIHIAAALIDDGEGRVLLVRKAGTDIFMQAGGKIEAGEDSLSALRRELAEEIGYEVGDSALPYLGRFSAQAANEPGYSVVAELFHLRTLQDPLISSEIAEARWVTSDDAAGLRLAPLTRDCVLPLACALSPLFTDVRRSR